MKINLTQLKAQLSRKLSPFYLVIGEELYLKQEALTQIRVAAKKANFDEHIQFQPETPEDAENLFNLLNTLPLLAEKKLIELDCSASLPNKALQLILNEYAENPSSHNLLLINLGKLDSKMAKLTWLNRMEKSGVLINIWPITSSELPQWILQRAKKFDLILTLEVATHLAEYVEGNLLAAAQSLEKMSLLNPKQPITKETIDWVMSDQSHYSIFDLVDHVIAGRGAQTLHILQSLQAEGVEPVIILWALVRELRFLAEFLQQLEQGETLESLFKKHKIFSKRQSSIRKFITHFSIQDCWQQLIRAHHIDKIIKGAAPGNVWNALQLLCLYHNVEINHI